MPAGPVPPGSCGLGCRRRRRRTAAGGRSAWPGCRPDEELGAGPDREMAGPAAQRYVAGPAASNVTPVAGPSTLTATPVTAHARGMSAWKRPGRRAAVWLALALAGLAGGLAAWLA